MSCCCRRVWRTRGGGRGRVGGLEWFEDGCFLYCEHCALVLGVVFSSLFSPSPFSYVKIHLHGSPATPQFRFGFGFVQHVSFLIHILESCIFFSVLSNSLPIFLSPHPPVPRPLFSFIVSLTLKPHQFHLIHLHDRLGRSVLAFV